ncbi:hypothetical protein SR1949_28860 [Sphaerospermopsis reniformis]|uniref:Uncharacterized protein n=1 Tax=Sphaerospermopsis reniformis TaxID=531300 RepID=A0A480A6A1_9CYAN|nr:hypothetical protein SR1949_28860 [Sphaerospermopsis reniformis]
MNCPYEWVSGYAYLIFGQIYLNDLRISRIRFNDGWLFLKAFFVRIRITRIIGFTGCYLMMVRYAQVMEGMNHHHRRCSRRVETKDTKGRGFREIFCFHPVHPLILDISTTSVIF